MLLVDYMVAYLEQKGVRHVFGYPGGMVTYLMDSFDRSTLIHQHCTYHEQGAAFAACGYGQIGNVGVAYATSGPGATNLITGICSAYFDSIPAVFITGQVNTNEAKGDIKVRQMGFQETDIVSLCKDVVKYSSYVTNPAKIKVELDKAFHYAQSGRPGPTLLDIPIDVQRMDVDPVSLDGFVEPVVIDADAKAIGLQILTQLSQAERPIIIAGNGINLAKATEAFRDFVDKIKIPVCTSMPAVDLLPFSSECRLGFIGAYGHRSANIALSKADLIVSMGSRLDYRQTGVIKNAFAKEAKIIRVDIDESEFANQIKPDERTFLCDIGRLLYELNRLDFSFKFDAWTDRCNKLKSKLMGIDNTDGNLIVEKISELVDDGVVISTDVGQNQVWVAQSFQVKKNQRILFSSSNGAMGYSLPAAIGAYLESGRRTICFVGDGGFQMNIQELQTVAREHIPLKIILLNNASLGMIRHFQEMYFDDRYILTVHDGGYTTPDFCAIVSAYGIHATRTMGLENLITIKALLDNDCPEFIEVILPNTTHVYPKLVTGKPIEDQDPSLDKKFLAQLIEEL